MKLKNRLIVVGLAITLANTLVFYLLFIAAYFTEGYTSCIDINKYGEATFEFIVLLVSIPLLLWMYYKFIKDIAKDEN